MEINTFHYAFMCAHEISNCNAPVFVHFAKLFDIPANLVLLQIIGDVFGN